MKVNKNYTRIGLFFGIFFCLQTVMVAGQSKGFIFEESPDSVVSMEAEHFYDFSSVKGTEWKVIPFYGKTLSAVTLLPTTIDPSGSKLMYRMKLKSVLEKVKVSVYLAPTLSFDGNEGMFYSLSFDGAPSTRVKMNGKEFERELYDLEKNRINIKMTALALTKTIDNNHILTFEPLSPGIVIEKIVVDCGGLKRSYLGPPESHYSIKDK